MQRFDHGGDIYGNKGVQLDFSANINPRGMPPGVKAALVSNMDYFAPYPDPLCRELTQALAAHHQVKPTQLACGNGAADMIFRLCACLKPRIALITAPTFSEYERAVQVHGGQVKQHLLKEEHDFDLGASILHAITPEVDMVFLCSPNNPTGRLINPDLLHQVAERCGQTGSILVLDECFIDFTNGITMLPYLERYPHLFILRAFTKMYAMAGLRLGYLLSGDGELLKKVSSFGAPWSVSSPAQVAGLAALRERQWRENSREMVQKERTWLTAELQRLGLKVFPGAANYLLIKSSLPLYQPLLDKGILVRDCGNYDGLDSHFIRVGIQTRDKNQQLVIKLQEVLHG